MYIREINRSTCVRKYLISVTSIYSRRWFSSYFDFYAFKHLECPAGYTGPGCNTACPYPSFGPFCGKFCNCNHSECDKIRGCRTGSMFPYLLYETLFVLCKDVVWCKIYKSFVSSHFFLICIKLKKYIDLIVLIGKKQNIGKCSNYFNRRSIRTIVTRHLNRSVGPYF